MLIAILTLTIYVDKRKQVNFNKTGL